MAHVTRTLNRLPFEDLELHRFEDLVRQLIYDFRPWRALEATGRSGGDEGFDVRGIESDAEEPNEPPDNEGDEDEIVALSLTTGRVWLIQCKREKSIGPTKLQNYLNEIPADQRSQLYGIIFVAAADFSLRSRDAFRSWCSSAGISECYIWGRGELEDFLYQPKNDHLLFAYFGISLAIRRRGSISTIRSALAIKRKFKKLLDGRFRSPVLIRAIDAEGYPYLKEGEDKLPYWKRTNRWRTARASEITHLGAIFYLRRFLAFYNRDSGEWDIANAFDESKDFDLQDPWEGEPDMKLRSEIFSFWKTLPEDKIGMIDVEANIKFENIYVIDEIGDEIIKYPHLYVLWEKTKQSPFEGMWMRLDNSNVELREDKRIPIFATNFRRGT